MYWKYHIEDGDLVAFEYDGCTVYGTVREWVCTNDDVDPDEASLDNVKPSDFALRIRSGNEDVDVPLPDIKRSVDEDERETDFPLLSERFRLSGGVAQGV